MGVPVHRRCIVSGILFLMTNKPDLGISLAAMAIALVVGAALPLVVRPRSASPTAPQTPFAVETFGDLR